MPTKSQPTPKASRRTDKALASSGGYAATLVIGQEYEVQGRFAKLEAIEGTGDFAEAVCRDRWDNRFTVSVGDVVEKRHIAGTERREQSQ